MLHRIKHCCLNLNYLKDASMCCNHTPDCTVVIPAERNRLRSAPTPSFTLQHQVDKGLFQGLLSCLENPTGFPPTGSVTCEDGQGATYLPSPPLFSPNQFAERTDKNSSECLLINSEIKIKVGKEHLPALSSFSGFLNSPKTLL